jgi:putative membrane protein
MSATSADAPPPATRRFSRALRAGEALRGLANWRHVLVAIFVNALVLALVVLILPGLTINATRPITGTVLLAIIYGVLKAYVKPVIQFVALKYLFATYGLVTIAINALLLWLVALLSLNTLLYSSLLALLVGGALAGLFSLILESVFGLTPPVRDRTEEGGAQ